MTAKEIGDRGEQCAADYLSGKGYAILCRNYHCRYGEIDMIAADAEYIVFVEVKTRAKHSYGAPSEAVDRRKRKKLILTAYDYLGKHPADLQPRFDVVEVVTAAVGNFSSISLNHIENAFILEDGDGFC